MSDVKSKNLYELLGNTSDQDSDREPEPPTKTVDKTAARSGKRDAPKAAPAPPAAPVAAPAGGATRGGGNRRAGGFTGSEAAFRDRTAGRNFNREKPAGEEGPDTGVRPGRESGPGVRRAGRGRAGPRRGGDRHSRTGLAEHQKQTDQAWGGATGEGEYADEKAGDAIAKEEIKEGGFDTTVEAPVDGEGNTLPAEEQEPEDTSKSYADYLTEKAAKKLEELGLKEAREVGDGSDNKKWANAKPLAKDSEDEYFAGQEKSRRERERTSKKEFVDVDYSFKEPARESRDSRDPRDGGRGGRGGRGRGRGGRGEFGGERGRGRGRGGAPTAGRGRGGAGATGGGNNTTVALNDESAFPSLGA